MVRITRARLAFCLALLLPAAASAQATRHGPTFSLGGTTSPVDSPDVAHDSIHNQYLQVAGKVFIEAHLVNGSGTLLSTFRVNSTGEYAQTPRVAFSPDIAGGGGYLVTWHSTLGPFTRVRGRIFRFDGAPITADFDIATSAVSGATSSNWTMGPAIAYASASQEFLVAWMGYYTSSNDIFFQRVANSGGLLGGNTRVSPGSADWERDPSVAYNSQTDEFYIAYAGYSEAGRFGFVAGRRVKAGSGAFTSGQLQYGAAVSTYVPSISYNTSTGQYLLGWYNRSASGAQVYGATLDANGGVIGNLRVLSPFYAAYDALDIDYNPASGQSLLVTHGGGASSWEDAGVSILANGAPFDNGFILTNTTDVRALRANPANSDGNFNPRVASSSTDKVWLMVTSSVFSATHAQFVAGQGVNNPLPPPAAVSRPMMALDLPSANASVSTSFTIAGWALDSGAPSGTGVEAVQAWAFPTNGGAAMFLGAATVGIARPDVGAYLADSRFTPSGFGLSATLPYGTYDIRVFAFSTVTREFNNSVGRRITVAPPVSQPRMAVDTPVQNQTITQNIAVEGWAVDLGATSGPGIETVHVWAYPVGGGAPILVGAAGLHHPRADVAAAAGSAQFMVSGFSVVGTLPPGEYNLVVYAFSAVVRTFNQSTVIRVRVV